MPRACLLPAVLLFLLAALPGVGDEQVVKAVDAEVRSDHGRGITRRPHTRRSGLMVGGAHPGGERLGDRLVEIVDPFGAKCPEGLRRQHLLAEVPRVGEPPAT